MAPHSSTLAWKIPWMEEPDRLQSMGSRRVVHDWATSLSLFTVMHGEGNGNPLQCSCWRIPGTGEPGGLPSMGSQRVGHDWVYTHTEHALIKCFWLAVNSSHFNLVKTILIYRCYCFKSFLENTMQSVSKCTVVCRNSYCAFFQMNCGFRWSGKPLWNTGVTLLKNPKEFMRATVKT